MAQAGYTPILIYASGTATNIPTSGNLISGSSGAELAINYADGKLYYKDSSGNVKLLSIGYGSSSVTPTNGGVQYGTGTALALTAAGSSGQILRSNGAAAPTWADLSTLGVNTISFGTTGLTPNSATAGAVTVAGTLVTANGGTGLGGATPFTANGVLYASSASALTSGSALTFDGTNLGIGTSGIKPLTIQLNDDDAIYVRSATSNASTFQLGTGSLTYLKSGSSGTGTVQPMAFFIGASEGMRLTSTGLGIGTSSPAYKLEVNGGATDAMSLFNSTNVNGAHLRFAASGTVKSYIGGAPGFLGSGTADDLGLRAVGSILFATAGSGVDMTLDSSGNLGIGTSLPAAKLDVAGTVNATGTITATGATQGAVTIQKSGTLAYSLYSSAAGTLKAYNNNTGVDVLTLDNAGNLGLGVTPSAWNTGKAFEVNAVGTSLWGAFGNTYLNANYYYNAADKFAGTGYALQYLQVPSTGAHIWKTSSASGSAGGNATLNQLMTLDASGNLGVGETSMGTIRLVVRKDNATAYSTSNMGAQTHTFLTNNTNGGYSNLILGCASATSGSAVYAGLAVVSEQASDTNGALAFGTRPSGGGNITERARITSGGDLLVGTTNASASAGAGLKVLPAANGTDGPQIAIVTAASTNTTASLSLYSTGAAAYRFYVADGGTVYATSTSISGISDQRFKENIVDLDVGLNAVMALKPRKFDWKAGKGKDIKGDRGFIAQEFEQVFPDLIDEWKDPAPQGEEPYKSVRQDLIPVLVKAIQEQQALITSLTARVALLEGN